MNKKTLIGIGIGILVFAGIVLLAKPDSASPKTTDSSPSSPIFQTDTARHDFGRISMAAGTVKKTFIARNTTGAPVEVRKLYTSCMCTIASLRVGDKQFGPFGMQGHGFIPSIDTSVQPGGEIDLDIVFDPAAHGPAGVGHIERTITIETDKGPVEFFIAATVTP